MGVKMTFPGIYEFDPDVPDEVDDLKKHEDYLRWSNITPEFQHSKRLCNFEMVAGREKGFEAACQFIRGEVDPPLLMLYGEPGRSKTHLAVAIGLAWIAQLKRVYYYYVGDLLDDLRAGLRIDKYALPGDHNPNTTDNILKRVKAVSLLILDDMGIENQTDWAFEKLDTIINHRYDKRLATVVTANTLEISDRILDRCREGLMVKLEGESYREIIRKRKAEAEKPARVRRTKDKAENV